MRKHFYLITTAALTLVINSTGAVQSQTWVCDEKSAAGFNNDQGFRMLNVTTNRSYIIRSGITADTLSFEWQKTDTVFQLASDYLIPASIQRLGDENVELCKIYKIEDAGNDLVWMDCDLVSYGNTFRFNIITGRYSLVSTGFENSGSGSYVEVGECRRTQ